jgi:hypothetical protein
VKPGKRRLPDGSIGVESWQVGEPHSRGGHAIIGGYAFPLRFIPIHLDLAIPPELAGRLIPPIAW